MLAASAVAACSWVMFASSFSVYGDGGNVRDWLYVEDHCDGILRVLDKGRPGESYNIGGNCERTNLELVGALCTSFDGLFADEPRYRESYPDALAAGGLVLAVRRRDDDGGGRQLHL